MPDDDAQDGGEVTPKEAQAARSHASATILAAAHVPLQDAPFGPPVVRLGGLPLQNLPEATEEPPEVVRYRLEQARRRAQVEESEE